MRSSCFKQSGEEKKKKSVIPQMIAAAEQSHKVAITAGCFPCGIKGGIPPRSSRPTNLHCHHNGKHFWSSRVGGEGGSHEGKHSIPDTYNVPVTLTSSGNCDFLSSCLGWQKGEDD